MCTSFIVTNKLPTKDGILYLYISLCVYRMIEAFGPTNTRRYTVAVYFRQKRLATGEGHSIQQAEMAAATNALNERAGKRLKTGFIRD